MNPTGKGGFGDHPEHRNDDGRPEKGQSLADLAKKYLDEKYGKKGKLTRKELFIARCYNLAIKGDYSFARLIWNHIDGMPVQKQVLAGDEEMPVRLIIDTGEKDED